MIAALPMYDWPEVAGATDALWAALRVRIAEAGFDAPLALTRDAPLPRIWSAEDLLIAQTCGLPYVAGAARAARLVGTPIYEVEGCAGPAYRSALVARRGAGGLEALRGARFARNEAGSLSGWAAPLDLLGRDFFGEIVETGAHRASVQAVAEGRADLAAVDAVAWRLARLHEPASEALEVVGWTAPFPATPFITSALHDGSERAALRAAFAETLADPMAEEARVALGLAGIAPATDADYDPVRRLARTVRAAG